MDGKRIAALLVAADVLLVPLIRAVPAAAATASEAPGAPGANATWDESQVTGFADSLGASSKVWYTLGNGELENVFYPVTDTADTFGLQYIVTNGTSFPPRPCSSTPTTTRSSTTTGWATPAAPTPPAVTWWRPTVQCPARWPPRPASTRWPRPCWLRATARTRWPR